MPYTKTNVVIKIALAVWLAASLLIEANGALFVGWLG